MVELDADVFASILAYITDTATLHAVLHAIPKSHQLFPAALDRLWQSPVYLDSYHPETAAASEAVLDCLLQAPEPLAGHLRHLVVRLEHDELKNRSLNHRGRGRGKKRAGRQNPPGPPQAVLALQRRVVDLLDAAPNLRSFDYHGYPGLRLDSMVLESLGQLERLDRFAVDCARCSRVNDVPAAGGDYAEPGALSALYDAENWDIDSFSATIGPSLSSLELRHVNYTMFGVLKTKIDDFKTYHALHDLKLDITEGVWDWGGGGSPAMGATPAVDFPFLGFPSVRRFELIVCDKTLSSAQKGPLNMVKCGLLTELHLDVRSSIWWWPYSTIHLFEALSPLEMPALRLLEVKDNTKNTLRHYWKPEANVNRWIYDGREYLGLVPLFLGSIMNGALPNLTSLWVDERVLMPANISVHELLVDPQSKETVAWVDSLRVALRQLTSLRVGFGRINDVEAEAILGLCDPAKLTQFGFEWNWQACEPDQPLSPRLLKHLSRFTLLTDIHILFPRPETEGESRIATDPRTVADVAALFECNPHVVCVGIGNSVVWERSSSPVLVCDGRGGPDAAVPRFFHAGFMLNGLEGPAPESDNSVPARPQLGQEIHRLRDLLRDIMT